MSVAQLSNAYQSQPQATCNSNRRAKRLGYILHGRHLKAVPASLPVVDDHTHLPSGEQPSDDPQQ